MSDPRDPLSPAALAAVRRRLAAIDPRMDPARAACRLDEIVLTLRGEPRPDKLPELFEIVAAIALWARSRCVLPAPSAGTPAGTASPEGGET